MNAPRIVPSRDKWGQYLDETTGQVVKMADVSEQTYYDSELLPVAIGAGREFILCTNLNFSTGAVKVFGADYNLPEMGRVPLEWYYSVQQIGFDLPVGIPFADLQAIVNSGYMEFRTGSQKEEASGRIKLYPTGYGIGGVVAIDGNAGATEVSAANIGTPAPASVPNRKYTIELPGQTSFELRLRFPYGATLTAITQIFFNLKVVRFRPVV